MGRIYFHLLAYCMSIGLSTALIGDTVRACKRGEFPYAVSISKRTPSHIFVNTHRCTGTLISRRSVLTVAHCLLNQNISEIQIIAGNKELRYGTVYYPESWITFTQWKYSTTRQQHSIDDIAIITIQGSVNEDIKSTSMVALPLQELVYKEIRMAGWGKTENNRYPSVLRSGTMRVISNEDCTRMGQALKAREPQRPNANPFAVPPNYFCSVGSRSPVFSTCGDAGAPIVTKSLNQLVGINIGLCPVIEELRFRQPVNNDLMNTHLLFMREYVEFVRNTEK